jgi:acyl-CoA reductase-like NAD-dependent aldehyde dehydrogenase
MGAISHARLREGFFPALAVRQGQAVHGTYQEEIFGPVLQIARAKDFEEAASLP